MEYKDVVYWLEKDSRSKILYELYIGQCLVRLNLLGDLIGCHFPIATNNRLKSEIFEAIRVMKGDTRNVRWYGTIVDRKKYLLAKIKYGI